jgi:acyl-CoA thioesterase-1
VVLELGANDALRGLPLASTRANLEQMVHEARDAGAGILLVGIRIPPNYGARYGEEFANIFPDLAKQYHLPLVPFLLQDVALNPVRMQEDGMHPNAAGEPVVLETVWPYLQPLIKKNP